MVYFQQKGRKEKSVYDTGGDSGRYKDRGSRPSGDREEAETYEDIRISRYMSLK